MTTNQTSKDIDELNQPIPFDLIRKIVKFRVKENLESAKAKGKKK
jgi:uncharacterized protein YdhG (YjbR/CyaY superfamily)